MIFEFFRFFDIVCLILIAFLFPIFVCKKWGSVD